MVENHRPEDAFPVALCLDGAYYVAVWIVALLTERGHVVSIFRKRIACKSGYRGLCWLDVVIRFVRWCVQCNA